MTSDMNERSFETGNPRTESAEQKGYQSAKTQETAGKAQPQEDREKTARAMHAARQQLANEPTPLILAVVLPVAEAAVRPAPAEPLGASDIAGQIVGKAI